jgi:hypothetical protein
VRTPARRPRSPDAPASAPADGERPTKPAKRAWSKPDFAKKGAKGKPDFKGKKSFGAKGPAKYKSKAPK